MEIIIEPQKRDQDEEFRLAFQESFQNKVGDHYTTWKYWDNPWNSNFNYVALHQGKIVGALGCLLKDMSVNGKAVKAAHEMDMFVLKEYRKAGTYFNLFRRRAAETLNSGAAFSFGVTSAFLKDLSVRLFGFTDIGEIPHLCKVITPSLFFKKRFGGGVMAWSAGLAGDIAARGYDRMAGGIPWRTGGIEIHEIATFDDAYDSFWVEALPERHIVVTRDSAYMNWRYNQNPDTSFVKLAARRNGRIRSVLVYTQIVHETRKALLMEFLTLPREERAGRVLLSEAVRRWKIEQVETAWCWMFDGSPGYGTLRRFGFIPRRKDIHLTMRRAKEEIPLAYLEDSHNWYLTLGDADFFYGRQI